MIAHGERVDKAPGSAAMRAALRQSVSEAQPASAALVKRQVGRGCQASAGTGHRS
jgi:hypothetical protein